MVIEAQFYRSEKQLYSLNLGYSDNPKNSISVRKLNSDTIEEASREIDTTIYSMPGFLMLVEKNNLSKADFIDFKVSGDNVLIVFFVAGNCSLFDNSAGRSFEYYPGIIRRSRSQSSHFRYNCPADIIEQRLTLVLSYKYVCELLKNEVWAVEDDFFSEVNSLLPEGILEHYFIDSNIKAIVNDLSVADNYGLHLRAFLELKLKELFFTLHVQHELSSIDRSVPKDIYIKLVNAKAFLLANFTEAPTIKQLSRVVVLNEFKLKKHFKELFGITIHSFIIQLRMEEAERLLREDCSVGEVALRTGYRSVSHFIATFKSYYGQTPMQAIKSLHMLLRRAI